MIVISGTFRIDAAYLDQAVSSAQKHIAKTNEEAGCGVFNLSVDLTEKDLFWVIEEWESETALLQHYETPHYAAFMQDLRGFGVHEMNIQRYDVSEKRPLRSTS